MTQSARPNPCLLHSEIVFTFALALGLAAAWYVRNLLLLIYVSALFAVVLMPVVRGIMKVNIWRWSPNRGITILILSLVVGGLVTLFFAFALPLWSTMFDGLQTSCR